MEKNKIILLLIVEDEKILSDTLEEKLLLEGFKVIKAYDGDEALRLALANHPDLILLDLLLPKVDGKEMLKKLREDKWGAHIPIIILTNIESPSMVAEIMSIDNDSTFEYLVKNNTSLSEIVAHINKKLNINN